MEDLVSLLFALLIIYTFLIGSTLLLISKLYKSYFVCGIHTKEIMKNGSFNYNSGDSNDRVTSYFSFKTKDGRNINRGTSLFPMTKTGKKRYFLYNDDRNEIVAQIYTLLWQTFIFIISLLYSLMAGIVSFIIAILIIIITVWIYSKYYQKKYVKGVK